MFWTTYHNLLSPAIKATEHKLGILWKWKSLSHVQLFVTSWTVVCQASLSMGFSRQESWSGLPCPLPGDLPNSGIKLRSLTLLADSLPSEPPGKPKNSGVGSLCLLQGNFLTQELNWGLLHCRWILNQLSYLGSPCSGLKKHKYVILQFWTS